MHRRTFVQSLGAALVAPAIGCTSSGAAGGAAASGTTSTASSAAAGRRLARIGLQLYSLRDAARGNLDQTLADIRAAGYDDVELLMSNNNFDTPAAQVRAMLDKHGLRAPSTHMGSQSIAAANLERTLDEADVLGHRYLFVASLPADARRSLDAYKAWGDRMNEAGAVARKRNIWIGFHNHGDDHVMLDGAVAYDALLERTDPSVVRMQLDTGNAAMGGRDPLDYMKRYGDRYWSFHIKDVPSMRAKEDAELGKGILDLRAILALAAKDIDQKLVYVEQESYPGSPLESVKRDYQYISKLQF
jgi:sugar phosphate isomerase/epimerase